jgi:hypothetical protein
VLELRRRAPVNGVIAGVSEEVVIEELKSIPGVVDARRMNRWVSGKEKKSLSILVVFYVESLPTTVKLGCVLSCKSFYFQAVIV